MRRPFALAWALAFTALVGPARAAEPFDSAVKPALTAFRERVERASIPAADLEGGKLTVLLRASQGTSEHVDVEALVKPALGSKLALTQDPAKARGVLYFTLAETSATTGTTKVRRITAELALARVKDVTILAAAVHEAIVRGTKVLAAGKEWDQTRASLDIEAVPTDAVPRAVRGLVDGLKRAPALDKEALVVMSARKPGEGPARDGKLIVAQLEEGLVQAGRCVLVGVVRRKQTEGVAWGLPAGMGLPVEPIVTVTPGGIELALDCGWNDKVQVAPDGKAAVIAAKPIERAAPEGVRIEARVAKVEKGRALLSVGSDDQVEEGWFFEIWRGTRKLATAKAHGVLKDSCWVDLVDVLERVEAGDSAYGVAAPEEIEAYRAASRDAANEVVRALEKRPRPANKAKTPVHVFVGGGRGTSAPDVAQGELERAIAASSQLKLGDGGATIDGHWTKFQPGGSEATEEVLVLQAEVDKLVVAGSVGVAVREGQTLVPRAEWASHFRHAFGPLEEEELVAALRPKLEGAGLAKGPVFSVVSPGQPALQARLEAAVENAGGVRKIGGDEALEVKAQVTGDAATQGGVQGGRFTARVVVTDKAGKEVASVEKAWFKPD